MKSLELLLKIKADNATALRETLSAVRGVASEAKTGSVQVEEFERKVSGAASTTAKLTAEARAAARELERMAKVQLKPDVGIGSLLDSARKASSELAKMNEQQKKVAEQQARLASKPDVGIGALADSARRASEELRKVRERNDEVIKSIERQAALAGKNPLERLQTQRGFAVQDYGKTAADVDRINAAYFRMAQATKAAEAGQTALDDSLDRGQASMTGAIVKGQILASAIMKAAEAIKAATYDATVYAARTQTLGIVNERLAKSNNLNADGVKAVVQSVKALGITQQEALNTVNQMIFANLDLAKATDIARLAQDAAVVAGMNSSETLQGIIHGIRSQQVEVLRTYGINVNFETAFIQRQRELGRELSAAEKQQLAFNEVLKQAPKIAGTYEAALDTAGKKMGSLKRFVDEAKNAIGNEFLPILGKAVDGLTSLAQFVEHNASTIALLVKAIGLATGMFALFKIGGVISELVLFGQAAAGAAAGFTALTGAIAANPIGLALAAVGATIALLIHQTNELKGQYATMFDIDEASAKKLEDRLTEIADKMRAGTATARDYADAVREAMDPRQRGKDRVLGTGGEAKRGSFQDFEFRDFVQQRFGKDPALLQQMVEEGNQVATAMARSMQTAFQKEFKPDFTSPFKVVIPQTKTPEQSAAEKAAAAKEAAAAAKEVKELERTAQTQELDGIKKINAEREATIEKLGKTADLIQRINKLFDDRVKSAGLESLEKALGLTPNALRSLGNAFTRMSAIQDAAQRLSSRAALGTAQEVDPISFPKDRESEADRLKRATDAYVAQLKRSIDADEIFLRESKKVIDAARDVEVAKTEALLSQTKGAAARQERSITASTRPGDEASANAQIFAVRSATANRENELAKQLIKARLDASLAAAATEQDRTAARYKAEAELIRVNGELKERLLDIEQEKTVRILELRRRQIEEFRDNAGKVFDALTSNGQSSLKDFLNGYVKTIQRSLFVNGAEELFKGTLGKLSLPGQSDGQGNLTLIGRLLRGTPLAADPAKLAQEANTTATKDNSRAIRDLTTSLRSTQTAAVAAGGTNVGGPGGAAAEAIDAVASTVSSGGARKLFTSISRSASSVVAGATGAMFGNPFGGLRGDRSISLGDGRATTASAQGLTTNRSSGLERGANITASALNTARGVVGVVDAFRGGNKADAVEGGLTIASNIPGPQQPYIAAAASIFSLARRFTGTSQADRSRRDKEVADTLNKNRADSPIGGNYETDLYGNSVDYDSRGRTRVIVMNKTEVNVSALDTQSFLDRSADVAAAVQKEALGSNEPLRQMIQAVALG